MNFPWLHKIVLFICKDTGKENESPKLIVVLRLLILSMLFYIVVNSIIYISILNNIVFAILFASFIMFLIVFYMSYRCQTMHTVAVLNLCMVCWSTVSVYYFGWDTGVQHFLLVQLVLCFFSGYSHYCIKSIYAIVLCGLRIYLYFLCRNQEPIVILDVSLAVLLQMINTVTIFWCISMISYTFSKDSQSLESKLIEYNTKLQNQAHTDALTGLYNRRKAKDYLERLLTSPDASCISVCMCDIDFFKRVNDSYGHDVGDVVLKEIAKTMQKTLRNKAFVSRWGGEEFLLVFPSSNGDDACFMLETLRSNIKALQFKANEKTFSVTMTFGLAEYDFQSDMEFLIKEADEKLYMGKESGRDRIIY